MDHLDHHQPPTELNFLTLNCWGLKYISKLRSGRLLEIGRRIAAASPCPHIVALQEVWTQDDYRAIRRETRNQLPYGKFYHSGAFGAGLVILSKWPFEESSMIPYPLSGRPTAFFRGDWYVGKGIACATIRFGPSRRQVVQVFNTHLHADYRGDDNTYACHRAAEAWELSKLARAAVERGHLVVALGDFNMLPSSMPYRLLTAHAPLRDTWRLIYPDSALGPQSDPAEAARNRPTPSASANVLENGVTSNSALNTWSWTSSQKKHVGPGKDPCFVPADADDSRAKRIDYIFAGYSNLDTPPEGLEALDRSRSSTTWIVDNVRVSMLKRHPELGVSLSDHLSVEATLKLVDLPTSMRDGMAEMTLARSITPELTIADSIVNSGAFLSTQSPGIGKYRGPRNSRLRSRAARNPDDYFEHGRRGSPYSAAGNSRHQRGVNNDNHDHGHDDDEDNQDDDGDYDDDDDQDWTRHSLQLRPTDSQYNFSSAAYDEVLSLIHHYVARERDQRFWRSNHFFAALILSLACMGVVWVSPYHYVSFILILFSTLNFAAGTVDGLMALLFFNAELGALKEFQWEIMNAKAASLGGSGLKMDHAEIRDKNAL